MTTALNAPSPFSASNENPEFDSLRVAQAPLGFVTSVPSSLSAGSELLTPKEAPLS